ncbi:sensor histidine kinase [Streptomyces sp. NPDC018057]|uniref:sensor histidine kinase n=1 Tax=unclassified Streptomyces TaxID=2593676 RepID=UPI00379C8D0A
MRLWVTPRQRLRLDTLIALALLGVTLGFALGYRPAGWPPFDARAIALTSAVHLPLVVRRVAPWPVLCATCAGLVLYTALGYQPSVNVWSPMLAFFTIASAQPTRRTALSAVPVTAVWVYNALASHAMSLLVAVGQTLVVLLLAWGFGMNLRRLEKQNTELDRLTARLRAEEGARARHAVTEERLRIARELHDVVAHHLSVVSVQSGLARYVFDTDTARARAALCVIEDTARETLEEMRGLLQVLRVGPDGTEAVSGPPAGDDAGLARLGELTARTVAAGLVVETEVSGTPRPLAPGADLCAYRIVQEALTNTLKHAGARARVRISLAYEAQLLSVTVSDDGGDRTQGPPAATGDDGPVPVGAAGHGVAGTAGRGAGGRKGPAGRAARAGRHIPESARTAGSTSAGGAAGRAAQAAVRGTGHGLVGMYERVRLYGGSFRAGPGPGPDPAVGAEGFEVAFTLPVPYRPERDDGPDAVPSARAAEPERGEQIEQIEQVGGSGDDRACARHR